MHRHGSSSRKLTSVLRSVHICEQTFSLIKLNKDKLQSHFTDYHFQNIQTAASFPSLPNVTNRTKGEEAHLAAILWPHPYSYKGY